jgi:hypothetical protein
MPEFAYTQILVATARSDETRAPGLPQEIAESGFVYDPPRELLAKTDEELGSMLRPVLMSLSSAVEGALARAEAEALSE